MILSLPVRITSAGMLSMPGDLPILTVYSFFAISCLRIGSGSLFSFMTFSMYGTVSPVTGWLYSSVQYSFHLLIFFFCHAISFLIWDCADFPFF